MAQAQRLWCLFALRVTADPQGGFDFFQEGGRLRL
jgi:hypothetical protein